MVARAVGDPPIDDDSICTGELTAMRTGYRKPGGPVVYRGVWCRKLWWATVLTAVQDGPELTALYWPAGTPQKLPARPLTPRDLLSREQVELVDRTWVDTDVLLLTAPGAAHAVYAMWEEGQTSLRCWYVDLQAPLRRTTKGFDTRDHLLDIVISPDRSEWRWKDEDEFNEAVAIGVFSPEGARAIREEGERVIELSAAEESPFCDGWETWSPPEGWEIPAFPENWDRLEDVG
jgi:hypothetical protein